MMGSHWNMLVLRYLGPFRQRCIAGNLIHSHQMKSEVLVGGNDLKVTQTGVQAMRLCENAQKEHL